MIAFARTGDRLTVHLRGPETRATQLTCPEGWEFFGVELQLTRLGTADLAAVDTLIAAGIAGSRAEIPPGTHASAGTMCSHTQSRMCVVGPR